jgi:recombination protein RecR
MAAAIPAAMERLIRMLSRLPGVGEKTATRFAFHIIEQPPEYAEGLARALSDSRREVGWCSRCFGLSESPLCPLCADPSRDDSTVCVVEGVPDQVAIDRTGAYRGRYHVLHGSLAPLRGMGPDDLRLKPLADRVLAGGVKEVIVATNVDVEGEATALYIRRLLEPSGVRVTRIASGVPMGGDLEFMDQITLSRALECRREM